MCALDLQGSVRRAHQWLRLVKVLVIVLAGVLLVRTFFAQGFVVEGNSMVPTLLPGDVLLVNRAVVGSYHSLLVANVKVPGYGALQRKDIVVVEAGRSQSAQRIAKRLVGMPNDTVMMKDGVLYVNREPVEEPYAIAGSRGDEATLTMLWQLSYLADEVDPSAYFPTRSNWGPLVVPPEQYFVLGDNRSQSRDSRFLGFVPQSRVTGRGERVYFSFDAVCCRAAEFLRAVRWKRIGRVVSAQ